MEKQTLEAVFTDNSEPISDICKNTSEFLFRQRCEIIQRELETYWLTPENHEKYWVEFKQHNDWKEEMRIFRKQYISKWKEIMNINN